jgi:hypothetical protein
VAVEVVEIAVEIGDHVVSLYQSDAELARTVGAHLSASLLAGEQVVVVATPAHSAAFEGEIRAAGIDLSEARRSGRFLSFDAADTLASFMNDDGSVSAEGYRRVIGGLVRDAVATGRPVRAYGEMVALLWDAGNVSAAIELEGLWNDLGAELPFSLVCAYRHDAVSGAEHADALHQVCHLHSHVLDAPAPEVVCAFDAAVTAPGAARRFVLESLQRFGGYAAVEKDAALVVTELATNAVLHARSPFSVLLRAERSLLHISVEDEAPVVPMIGAAHVLAESGRGLLLIGALSMRCGVEALALGGKRVWAELRV